MLCSLLLVVILAVVWSHRKNPGTPFFIGILLSIALYTFGYSMELTCTTLSGMLFWNSIEYFAIIWIPGLWLTFILKYYDKKRWLTRYTIILLFLIPVLTLCIRLTNNYHHLFYSSWTIATYGTIHSFAFVRGIWYWVHITYAFLAILTGILVLGYNRRYSTSIYRTQSSYLLAAALVPLLSFAVYVSHILPWRFLDVNPFALTISVILVSIGMQHNRLLKISPFARNVLIENLPDGVVVLDMHNRAIDVNPAAMRLFDWDFNPSGLTAQHIWKNWPDIPALCNSTIPATVETLHTANGADAYCDVNYFLIKDANGRNAGKVIVAHDITARKAIETELHLAKETTESANEELRKAWVELAKAAETDYLTKCLNRRKFDEMVVIEMNRSNRYGSLLSILMFDIDHFKRANDTYGHHAGDNVLIEMAQIIRNNTRKPDVLARWGGEEFILLTPGIDISQALVLAEKLRTLVANHIFPIVGHITISIGVTQYMSFDSSESLVKRTDDAMYRAKESGRNRVEVGRADMA